jgi:hypothetical protein
MKSRSLFVVLAGFAAATALHAADKNALQAELMNVEHEFAVEVAKGDIRAAFVKFMAPDGFAPGDFALSRAELAARPVPPPPPPGFKLEWEPLFADASDDGTLGYTWGYFKMTAPPRDGKGETRTVLGLTMTIWKRQPDGSWKWVFDGGPQVPPDKIKDFLHRPDLPKKPALLN